MHKAGRPCGIGIGLARQHSQQLRLHSRLHQAAFLHGPEKHARINDYPVVFVAIKRVKRGYYEITLSVLADDPRQLAEGEITRRYAQNMEKMIREYPADWLWSHKRWKLIR